ncbi:OLC1v1035727C1 [Oldenlandia corymbosa var. corymbosa]|uniref:OLC1v1035727C1 n=1 Tax=Oldenlandia corymbosa var. corymbosa TaxID=529605 RepID=A0AAV1CTP3_OLDCO|nr:OLC1v1035727C1 [Oldenlandia corymbosa var. corymbosa]
MATSTARLFTRREDFDRFKILVTARLAGVELDCTELSGCEAIEEINDVAELPVLITVDGKTLTGVRTIINSLAKGTELIPLPCYDTDDVDNAVDTAMKLDFAKWICPVLQELVYIPPHEELLNPSWESTMTNLNSLIGKDSYMVGDRISIADIYVMAQLMPGVLSVFSEDHKQRYSGACKYFWNLINRHPEFSEVFPHFKEGKIRSLIKSEATLDTEDSEGKPLDDWDLIETIQLHKQQSAYPVHRATFNQDKSCLAVAMTGGFRIYDCNTGKVLHDEGVGAFDVIEMLFSTSVLAVVGVGEKAAGRASRTSKVGAVMVYNAVDVQHHSEIKAHRSPLAAMNFSADGTYIATASESGTKIRIHMISTSTKVCTLRRGFTPSQIHCLSFSPSLELQLPDMLIALSVAGSLHVFPLNNRNKKASLLGDMSSVHPIYQDAVPSGVKGDAVIRKLQKLANGDIRATVTVVSYAGSVCEYSCMINTKGEDSWGLEKMVFL